MAIRKILLKITNPMKRIQLASPNDRTSTVVTDTVPGLRITNLQVVTGSALTRKCLPAYGRRMDVHECLQKASKAERDHQIHLGARAQTPGPELSVCRSWGSFLLFPHLCPIRR
jgi:hypothetical protein